MNRPGSHRGAPSIKKKKFSRGLKKQPIPTKDKVREFIVNAISNAEEQSRKNGYVASRYNCRDLTDKFKCRIGEMAKIITELSKEGLTSRVLKRNLSFSIIYDNGKDDETKDVESYFHFEFCPICNSELLKNEVLSPKFCYDEETNNMKIIKKIVTRIDMNCKNKCFVYTSQGSTHNINIFKDKYVIQTDDHNSIKNHMLKEIKKEIERLKKNERYVMKIFENNL